MKKWNLWRQDDQGKSYLIDTYESFDDAKSEADTLEARGHKQFYWVEETEIAKSACSSGPRVNLLVITAEDIEATRAFYETLGFAFDLEFHGKGPEHYACAKDGFVLEIYPATAPVTPIRLGVTVDSAVAAVATLAEKGYEVIQTPAPSPWGMRAVTRDPSGNTVEVTSTG